MQPAIANDRSRADVHWNRKRIAILTTFGGARRRARLFQMTVGADQRPAAMIALLEHERWPANHSWKACYLWYLSTAPNRLLGHVEGDDRLCTPKMVGMAAFHVALAVALGGEAEGRLWLHAEPAGGDDLSDWYSRLGMQIIDPVRYPLLPGYDRLAAGRRNDGRYFCLDAGEALHDAFLTAMRRS